MTTHSKWNQNVYKNRKKNLSTIEIELNHYWYVIVLIHKEAVNTNLNTSIYNTKNEWWWQIKLQSKEITNKPMIIELFWF